LRRDLARWSDPKLVRALLGAEAEAARAFRPPPPELDDEDLRIAPEEAPGSTLSVLRELGSAEVSSAPLYQPPAPPRPALLRPTPSPGPTAGGGSVPPPIVRRPVDDNRWILWFTAIAFALGVLAILFITLLGK
jgi:serine/threonine-protein kinase